MTDPDETKKLVSSFSDKSRRAVKVGRRVLIPHKTKPDGEVVTQENLDVRVDISELNLRELKFLDIFREEGWDLDKAAKKAGIDPADARKTYRKCLWFAQEDAFVRAKAKVPTANYILAKDLDNVEKAIELDDSQHKSLDRLAKVVGAFKTSEINIQQNIFNMPKLTPEAEAELRKFADQQADIVEAEIAS